MIKMVISVFNSISSTYSLYMLHNYMVLVSYTFFIGFIFILLAVVSVWKFWVENRPNKITSVKKKLKEVVPLVKRRNENCDTG